MSLPQFKLRSLFVVIFCASIGLTCGLAPPLPDNASLYGIYVARFSWHYALLSAVSVAMVIGMFQQACALFAWRRSRAVHTDFRFATDFAIVWRLLIAGLLCICISTRLLVSRGVIELPESAGIVSFETFPESIWLLLMIVVFTEATFRRKCAEDAPIQSKWISVAAWLSGMVLALIVLPHAAFIHFLVHVATAGIEAGIPSAFQRAGTFPNHQPEGFRIFWISLGATVSVSIAIFLWFSVVIKEPSRTPLLTVVTLIALVLTAATFCVWFFGMELGRISPDFAGVGVSGSWLDFAAGAVMIAIASTTCAARFSRRAGLSATVEPTSYAAEPHTFLHESITCVSAAVIASIIYVVEFARMTLSFSGAFGHQVAWSNLAFSLLTDAANYLQLALVVASWTLGIQVWRQRGRIIPWNINAVSTRTFIVDWIVTYLIALIAISTIGIYCFVFWLGPWYLYGP